MRKPHSLHLQGDKYEDLALITAEHVTPKMIARSLGNTCRFTGHTVRFYSVAEHSILCATLLQDFGPAVQLNALLHDAGEIFTGDITPQLGDLLGHRWALIKRNAQEAIDLKFGIPLTDEDQPLIKWADNYLLLHEARYLCKIDDPIHEWGLGPIPPPEDGKAPTFQCWTPQTAGNMWLMCYNEIRKELDGEQGEQV